MGWIADRLFQWKAGRRQRREILERVALDDAHRKALLADDSLTPVERLIRSWDEPAPKGVSDDSLAALEQRYEIRLPDDFRTYLKAAMPDGNAFDFRGTRWWPLGEIRSVRDECDDQHNFDPVPNGEKCLVFADFLIWCHAWAIDCSDSADRGKIIFVSDSNHYVADSFDDFLDRYMRDESSIF